MTVFRTELYRPIAALLALALMCAPARAQNDSLLDNTVGATGGATGAPRVLAPGGIGPGLEPPADSFQLGGVATDSTNGRTAPGGVAANQTIGRSASGGVTANQTIGRSAPGGPVLRARGNVTVGELGNVEGPVVGLLTDANGGLGYREWEDTDRGVAETLIRRLNAATSSPSARLLLRKLLLTAAPPPEGRGRGSFNALRLRKLLEGGFLADAGELAAAMRSSEEDIQRAQADALLYTGRDEELCGDATSVRLASAELFWIQLRTYCYAVAGDMAAFELTRAVTEQQGLADASFNALLDKMLDPDVDPPETIAAPNALHVRILTRLGLALPANVTNGLGLPASLLAVESNETQTDVRRAAAEWTLRSGALAPEILGEILDLSMFEPQDLEGAAALARNEPLLDALARLRAALRQETQNNRRAELIYAAFQIGESQALLPQVAALFAEDAAALTPSPDWSNWSPLMARALLLAGRPDAASGWADLLDLLSTGTTGASNRIRIALVLADPNGIRMIKAQDALSALVFEVTAYDVIPATLARAALLIGLFEATGQTMPSDARLEIDTLLSIDFPGRRPAPLTMPRIEDAALDDRRGELVLNVLDAIGPRGPGDLAPDVTVHLVRALRTAGINDAADMLSLEAILVRPGAG